MMCQLKDFDLTMSRTTVMKTSLFSQKEGTIHESSCVNTLQQNGIAERRNDLLLDITRSLLFHKKVPKQYWGKMS